MAEQLTFALPAKPALGRADFLISPSNATAVAQIEAWRDWPLGKLALIGPQGSGKTHLAHVWATESGAEIVSAGDLPGMDPAKLAETRAIALEDADTALDAGAEATLFHLHNLLAQSGGHLLLTAATPPARWPIGLPDLASRMQATATAEIGPPDDTLLAALLVKLFADRQLTVPPTLIPYLVTRMERSFAAAQTLVSALDTAALAEGRAVGRALAGRVLDKTASDGT